MTIFYDRDAVRVTDRWLSVDRRRYPIDELHNLRMARGRGDRTARRAAYTATLSLLVVAVTARHVPLPASMIIAVVFVVLPATVAAVRARLVRPEYLLWADYRDFPVQLYQTRDATEFGKISRALVRASTGSAASAYRRSEQA
jgi:hypothetical protein